MPGKGTYSKRSLAAMAAFVALVLALLPLAACTQQPAAPAAAPTQAPAAPTKAAAAPEPTKPAPAPQPTKPAQVSKEVVIGYSGPLSGPAAEYGKDNLNGIDLAISEINAAGGVDAGNSKVTFKLESLDDQADPTQAVNNARRFRNQSKAIAVFNPVFTGIAPTMGINQEAGNEFLMMAYTSTPQSSEMGNKLTVSIPPPFTVYIKAFIEKAKENGWKKGAMLVTLGAYGDEWRKEFKDAWTKAGGEITKDQPANYYTETDFSAQLTADLATNPDFLLIGGPSYPTALVIEQARGLGFKGGFILIDQAKMDYIAVKALKGFDKMNGVMGVAAVSEIPVPGAPAFDKRYTAKYNVMNTWEAALEYDGMWALALAIQKAGTADDLKAIRAAFPQVFPLKGDRYPTEFLGIDEHGRMQLMAAVQQIKDGKYTPPEMYVWWAKTEAEFEKAKSLGSPGPVPVRWLQ